MAVRTGVEGVRRKHPKLSAFVRRGDGLEGVREPEMARLNGASYREVVDSVISRIQRWEAELSRVEWLMAEVGRGIRLLQPNRPGRLIVRWWKERADDQWRTPLLLRWVVRGGVSVLEPVGPKANPMGTGWFRTARGEVAGLLVIWWRLVGIRDWLLSGLSGLGRERVGRRIEVFEVVEVLSVDVDGLVDLGRRRIALMRGDGLVEFEDDADDGERR